MITKHGPAPCGIDQDVPRLEHLHRVFRRHDGRRALHPIQLARIDEIADGPLDGVERAEPERPVLQECRQVRGNGLSERQALFELRWIEDRLDAIFVDQIGAVALH